MIPEGYYECGEIGPFWVIIADDYDGQVEVRIQDGEWEACDPLKFTQASNLDYIRAKAAMTCRQILQKQLNAVLAFDPRKEL